jgi:Cation transporter/ATPase, N-terminus
MGSDESSGPTSGEAALRLTRYGENKLSSKKPPSVREVVLGQLRGPMNILLVAATVVSLVIDQVLTALVVALLLALNVVFRPAGNCRRGPAWTLWQRSRSVWPRSCAGVRLTDPRSAFREAHGGTRGHRRHQYGQTGTLTRDSTVVTVPS